MKIRSIITGVLCAGMLLLSSASAAQARRPAEPGPNPSSRSWTLTIERLLNEGRHASSIAEGRLIHADLILVLRDGI